MDNSQDAAECGSDVDEEVIDESTDPLYHYYTRLPNDRKHLVCKQCNKKISRGSGDSKKANTSNFLNHLKVKAHPDLYDAYVQKKKQFLQAKAEANKKTQVQEQTRKAQVQLNLKDLFNKGVKWGNNSQQQTQYEKLVMEMICIGELPFTIANELGFHRLVHFLEPRVQLRTDKFFRDLLHPTYDAVVEKVKLTIEQAPFLSFTTDVWTNDAKTASLLSLTAHFVNFLSGTRPKYVLAAMPIKDDHTGENLHQLLSECVLQTWHIPPEKIHAIVHDNGANMVKATTLSDLFADIRCFAHTLQLVIQDGIESQRIVIDMLASSRAIAGHFGRSEQACRRLKDIQQQLKLPEHVLKQCTPTRWNSQYDMLQRLIEQKEAIELYHVRHGLPTSLTSLQWTVADRVCKALETFLDITNIISADDAPVSVVLPFVKSLIKILEDGPGEGIGTMKETLIKSLKTRFQQTRINKNYLLATYLDPRFKNTTFDDVQKELTKSYLEQENPTDPEPLEEPTLASPPPTENPAKRPKSIWDFVYSESNQSLPAVRKEAAKPEREEYESLPLENKSANIYEWWNKTHQFPLLKKTAQKYLSSPATSVPSEQLFSDAGNIYDEKRSRLKAENAEKLLFLKKNLPLINFVY